MERYCEQEKSCLRVYVPRELDHHEADRLMGYFGGEVYAEHLSGRILKIFKVSGLHTLIRTSVPKQQKEREGEKHNA